MSRSDLAELLRAGLSSPRIDPALDLYGLGMMLRGCADGSAEGTASALELVLAWHYIAARVARWGDDRCASEAAFRAFLRAVLEESAGMVHGMLPGVVARQEVPRAE